MRYHNITTDDMLNGDGLRTVLWVAGCTHCCKDCQNPITWDINGGLPFTDEVKAELFEKLSKDYISGVTFSGGDPLHPSNIETITALAKEINQKFPDKTIWVYTGFTYEELSGCEILEHIDVLVDGEFMINLKDTKLKWCGSSNQRIIDVPASLDSGRVILYVDNAKSTGNE